MNTFRFSIVATAILVAAALSFAQTGETPPAGPNPSTCPGCARADDITWAAGMTALSGALNAQPEQRSEKAPAVPKADFSVEGMFLDVCSCMPPCPCEVTAVASGCTGVGVHHFSSGTYGGDDLSGVKIAHAKIVGQWVNLYIEANDEMQRAAAEEFGRAAFAAFGPINVVKAARIEISGADGTYSVTVDGGRIMKFETQPVLGGDGKTPIGITNIKNAVNPNVFQGVCVSATYSDGTQKVTVEKGRNSHFNAELESSGKI